MSEQLDDEGEFLAVIDHGGRDIPKAHALDHVMDYSLLNDAHSVGKARHGDRV